jgi:heme/copper-type cytochrome/quinol oxidase subunit 3
MRKEKEKLMLIWMIITVLLGMVFVGFEIYEINNANVIIKTNGNSNNSVVIFPA